MQSQISEVHDSFYELLIYESIEVLIERHQSLPLEKRKVQSLHKEIEEVGRTIGRKAIEVISKDVAVKFQTQLDAMKFLCTEFWKYVFSKQVDNLRTNNTGTFILNDDQFKFIARVSNNDMESKEYKDKVRCYEMFVIGLIRGALLNMGFD